MECPVSDIAISTNRDIEENKILKIVQSKIDNYIQSLKKINSDSLLYIRIGMATSLEPRGVNFFVIGLFTAIPAEDKMPFMMFSSGLTQRRRGGKTGRK